ncbi:MAG: ribonuclease J [Chloroflexota bacterium]|nr:ribonuclease J [Chloroflexota bacterium]MDE2885480.1 ribonuclease J [Chloroflexota bacterium]
MPHPIRIVAIGGLGEVGKNMLCVEHGDDIVVIDAGLMFPKQEMLGIDLVLPDISYLTANAERVRAILITHGHEDHTGALPYVLRELDVPVYAPPLAHDLIEVKLRQHRIGDVELHEIDAGSVLGFGSIQAEYFRVCHSIPDACGIALRTPAGLVVHTGDFKIDHTPADGRPTDLQRLAELGSEGVLLLLSDSTYAEVPGYTPSESVVATALEHVIADAPGRVLIATFASLIARVQQVLDAAVKHGRKVAPAGRSMIDNVNMAVANGYIDAPPGALIDLQSLNALPHEQQVIVLTGAQGEPLSVLSRVANNANRDIEVHENDTVVISATAIPGNETVIASVVDNLTRRGAKVLTRRTSPGVHVPGHGSQEELKLMLRLIKPRYFVPVHGEYRMLAAHADLARQTGVAPENVFVLEDGDVLELDDSSVGLVEPVPAGHVYVDGLRTWDVGEAVLRDRRMLSRDGFVVVVVPVDHATGRVYGEPEIVSSGFTVPGEAEELMERASAIVIEALRAPNLDPLNEDHVNDRVREALSRFLYKETRSRPMILTVPLEI